MNLSNLQGRKSPLENEPPHDKPTMHPGKTQISLGIHEVWSVFAVRMKKPWVLSYPLNAQLILIRLGGCPGWPESSLGIHIIFYSFLMLWLKWVNVFFDAGESGMVVPGLNAPIIQDWQLKPLYKPEEKDATFKERMAKMRSQDVRRKVSSLV